MKVCFEQFLGENHSWSLVGQNLARVFVSKGYEVHLKSTNGYLYFPEDLKNNIRENLDKEYDIQLTYTAMHNLPRYLSHGHKNRFGIWNYETTVLPTGFAKYYKFTDKFLPSSNFSKQIFLQNGIPEEHMVVVPHGISLNVANKNKYPLKTSKKYKILANIAQPHIRKNIPGLFEVFGRAFTSADDVCLVIKISIKKQLDSAFEVDFNKILNEFKLKYKNHAEVEVVSEFIPDIVEIYNACDIIFSMTYAECFWLPGIESISVGKLTIAPNYGGQLDFMNQDNSLLIDGKIVRAPKTMQYWSPSPYAQMFEPSIDDACFKLKQATQQYDILLNKFLPSMNSMATKFTWDNAVDQIIGLTNDE